MRLPAFLEHPALKPGLIYGVLGCSLALNLVMTFTRSDGAPDEAPAVAAPEEAPAAAAVEVAPAAAPTVAPALPAAPPATGWQVVSAPLNGSIARTFQGAVGEGGDALSAVYARLFVWDMDLRRDLQRGDQVDVAWREVATGDKEVGAARLHSQKLGKVLAAYRWQAPGDAFPSYWSQEGIEVPFRLKNSPLQDYEQITSLLKDRPTHQGMDFKTPVGTPVVSPKDGVVTRTNWNWSANGNCVEVRFADGVLAKFLHLSENKVEPGASVKAGQVVALTGNTGHSTAPHLHYQLNRGDGVLDPIDYHGAERRRLSAEAMSAFTSEVASLESALNGAMASR